MKVNKGFTPLETVGRRRRAKVSLTGFTIVELVMTIVIATVILAPTAVVVVESVINTLQPEYFTIASFLLEREVERIASTRFSAIANQGPTNYSGNFSNYAYQVSFYYVNAGALNTQVAGPTDYKRVTITISRSGFPSLAAVTLATNN